MKGQVNRVDKRLLVVPSWARKVLFWAAIILLVIHLFTPQVKLTVDGVSVALLVAACLPWLADRINGIKVGDFEITLSDVREPVRELEAAIDKGEGGSAAASEADVTGSWNLSLSTPDTDDPVYLFAAVRVDIERRLKRLAELHGIPATWDMHTTAGQLVDAGVMTRQMYKALRKYLQVATRAVHGADVTPEAMDEARSSAPTVLAVLDALIAAASLNAHTRS